MGCNRTDRIISSMVADSPICVQVLGSRVHTFLRSVARYVPARAPTQANLLAGMHTVVVV